MIWYDILYYIILYYIILYYIYTLTSLISIYSFNCLTLSHVCPCLGWGCRLQETNFQRLGISKWMLVIRCVTCSPWVSWRLSPAPTDQVSIGTSVGRFPRSWTSLSKPRIRWPCPKNQWPTLLAKIFAVDAAEVNGNTACRLPWVLMVFAARTDRFEIL